MQSSTQPESSFEILTTAAQQYLQASLAIEQEEKKETGKNSRSNFTKRETSEERWVQMEGYAISRPLFEQMGIIGIVEGAITPSTYESACRLASSNGLITLSSQMYKFGSRELISSLFNNEENEYFARSEGLVSKLQALSDRSNPTLTTFSDSKTKNSNVICALKRPFSKLFSPLFLSEGMTDDNSAEHYALRIHPFTSRRDACDELPPFKVFVIEFYMGGTSFVARKFMGEEIPIYTEANEMEIGEMLSKFIPSSTSFIEGVQFEALKLVVLMMLRLGDTGFKVICNLHFVENLLMLFSLHFQQKIETIALEDAIKALIERRKAVVARLTRFFTSHKISISFLSAWDNFAEEVEIPAGILYQYYFLTKLQLLQKIPDALDFGTIEVDLVNACLRAMSRNPAYPAHLSVWQNFITIKKENHDSLNTFTKIFDVADAITLTLAGTSMLPHEVCSIYSASRMYIQELQNEYSRLTELKQKHSLIPKVPQPRFIQLPAGRYRPQLKEVPHKSAQIKGYPRLFSIAYFDPLIAKNLTETPDEEKVSTGNAYYFKDTPQKSIAKALRYFPLFRQAHKNAATQENTSGHASLSKVIAVKKASQGLSF